jgi:hypothetical protein
MIGRMFFRNSEIPIASKLWQTEPFFSDAVKLSNYLLIYHLHETCTWQ